MKGFTPGAVLQESFGPSWFPNADRSPFRLVCLETLLRSRSKSPMLMRDYALHLHACRPAAASGKSDPLLELLAFAEGRFLTVHPFRNFNGRTIRVFLLELLRRPHTARAQQLHPRRRHAAELHLGQHQGLCKNTFEVGNQFKPAG